MSFDKRQAYITCFISVFILGSNAIFAKTINLSALHIILLRSLIAGMVLLVVIKSKNERFAPKSLKEAVTLSVIGILMCIHWVGMFVSIQLSTVAIAVIAIFTFPMFTSILEPLLLKTRFKIRYVFSAFFIILGLLIINPHFSANDTISQSIIAGLASALAFACRNIFCRKYIQHINENKLLLYQCLISTLILLPLTKTLPDTISSSDLLQLLVLATICTVLGHTLFLKSLRYLSANSASIIACIQPVYGILLAFILLHEIPSFQTILGGSVIFATVFMHIIQKYKKNISKKKI